MANVQFYQGTRAQLNNYPLDLGTIYFIPEERRLYIDTVENSKPKRIPVIGYSGLSFYLRIDTTQIENNKISLNNYYETTLTKPFSERDFHEVSLSEILGDNSIIYAGYSYYFNRGVFSKYLGTSNFYITETISNIENDILKTNIIVQQEGSDQNLPDVIYLYCYCPNPLPSSFEISVDYTVYTQTVTLYGTKNNNNKWVWNENERYYEYNTDFSLEDIDIRNYPFIIKPDDDSLENYMEWNGAIYIKDPNTTEGKIKFYSTSSYAPWFNIEVDIIVFIGEESKNGYWRGKHYYSYNNFDTPWESDGSFSIDSTGHFIAKYSAPHLATPIDYYYNEDLPEFSYVADGVNVYETNNYTYGISIITEQLNNNSIYTLKTLLNDLLYIGLSDDKNDIQKAFENSVDSYIEKEGSLINEIKINDKIVWSNYNDNENGFFVGTAIVQGLVPLQNQFLKIDSEGNYSLQTALIKIDRFFIIYKFLKNIDYDSLFYYNIDLSEAKQIDNQTYYDFVSDIYFNMDEKKFILQGDITEEDVSGIITESSTKNPTEIEGISLTAELLEDNICILTPSNNIMDKNGQNVYKATINNNGIDISNMENKYIRYYLDDDKNNALLIDCDFVQGSTYSFRWNDLYNKWVVSTDGELFVSSFKNPGISIIQTNGISNMYKMIIPNKNKISSSGKIIDETTGQIQPQNGYWIKSDWGKRSLNDALINLEEDIYMVQMTPTNDDKSLAKIVGKHNPIVVPLDYYEEFNKIIECRVYQDGNIYFFAIKDNLPEKNIPIMVIDFK